MAFVSVFSYRCLSGRLRAQIYVFIFFRATLAVDGVRSIRRFCRGLSAGIRFQYIDYELYIVCVSEAVRKKVLLRLIVKGKI